MKEEKKFLIPEAIIIAFDSELDTLGESGGDLDIPLDPSDPNFPGY